MWLKDGEQSLIPCQDNQTRNHDSDLALVRIAPAFI
jgi:hypothetical protein